MANKQRFQVPLEKIYGNVPRDDWLTRLQEAEITTVLPGRNLVADMLRLALLRKTVADADGIFPKFKQHRLPFSISG